MRYLSSFASGIALLLTTGCAPASRWQPLVGFHAGTPANYSAAVGVGRVLARQHDSTTPRAHADVDAFALVEPGWSAGRVSVGLGSDRERLSAKYLVNTRVTELRRWSGASTGNYLGVELEAETIDRFSLGLRIGLFSPVARRRGDRPLFFTIDYPAGW